MRHSQQKSRQWCNMKRRLLTCALLFACLVLVCFFGIMWWTAPVHRINEASFAKLKEEMTQSDIEAILGVPPGEYGQETTKRRIYPSHNLWMAKVPVEKKEWGTLESVISVWFDGAGRMVHCDMSGVYSETFFDKLRRSTREALFND
jgi:hypothetical protein